MNYIDYLKMMAAIYNAIADTATPLMKSHSSNARTNAEQVAYSVIAVHRGNHRYMFVDHPTYMYAHNHDEAEFDTVKMHFGELTVPEEQIEEVLTKITAEVEKTALFYKSSIKPDHLRKIVAVVNKTATKFHADLEKAV